MLALTITLVLLVCEDEAQCRKECDAGSVQGCSLLGHQLLRGKQEVPPEALKLLEGAAAKREPAAMGTLGLLFISGQGVKKDEAKGARLLTESCGLKYWPACDTLGLAYEKGAGVKRDPDAAVKHYERACSGGVARSCLTVGDLFENGIGVKADKKRAVELYQRGCRQGHEPACAAVTRAQSQNAVDTPQAFGADVEKAIAPALAEARRTWPKAKERFLAGLLRGHRFFVTTTLREPDGRKEQVFVEVRSIDKETGNVLGILSSEIGTLKSWKEGDSLTVRDRDVRDWTIVDREGKEEGNFVGKFLDTYRP